MGPLKEAAAPSFVVRQSLPQDRQHPLCVAEFRAIPAATATRSLAASKAVSSGEANIPHA